MNKWIFGIISFAVIACLWVFQSAITVNIPWWDDFHGIILPVFDLFTGKTFWQKIQNFVSLNNEHRVVNDRIFTLIIYLFTGKFELRTLALLGFVNLIGILWIILKVLRKENIGYLALLPIVFLIFQAQYFESLQSLMVPFQNFSVILYAALSIYLLIYKENFGWSFFFALMAIFSHGNGILVFIIGFLILVLNAKYKQAWIWTALSVLTVFVYFLGYSKPKWTSTDVVSPFENPVLAIRYMFEFLGAYSLNIIDLSTGLSNSAIKQIFPQIVGLIFSVVFLFLVFRKYPPNKINESPKRLSAHKANQFFIAFSMFFVATAVIIGLTRAGFPILSRYTINSAFFLITVYGFFVINYSQKVAGTTSAFTFLILLFSYYNASDRAFFNKENAKADAVNYRLNGTWVNQYADSAHVSRVNPLLVEPLKAGKYVFPKDNNINFPNWNPQNTNAKLEYSIVDGYLMIYGECKPEVNNTYFSLESENDHFLFPAGKVKNNILAFLKGKSYYSNLFKTAFPTRIIPNGNYEIYLIETSPSGTNKFKLNRTLVNKNLVL